MNPYVKSVKPQENYCLLLTFENREKRIFDLKPYLKLGVFSKLQDIAVYNSARIVSGSVEWQGEIDLSHDTLYLESVPVKVKPNRSSVGKRKLTSLRVKPVKQTRAGIRAK
jgi:Protein of unknown function (DUF2442)